MSELGSAIDELAVEDLDATPPTALADDLVDLRRAIDRLEAEWLRRLAVFDGRGAATTSCRRSVGCGSTVA